MTEISHLSRLDPRVALAFAMDERAVLDLVARYAEMADKRDFAKVASIFTEDVVAEYPWGRVVGARKLADYGQQFFERFARTQHVITNPIATLDADGFEVRANLIATHVNTAEAPSIHFDTGAVYTFALVKLYGQWKIRKLRLALVWTSGKFP